MISLLLLAGLVAGYVGWGRTLAGAAVAGTAPEWFQGLVNAAYPRLAVEKHRFEPAFFLRKADQVVLRFALVAGLLVTGRYLLGRRPAWWASLHAFPNRPVPANRVRVLRILFYAALLFFSHEWYFDLSARYGAAVFYKPLPLLRLLHLGFPPPPVLAALCGLLWAACGLAMLNVRPVAAAGLAAGLFVLLQAWLYSFEKMDHTYALLTYAALPMPFLLAERQRALREGQLLQAAWPLRLIQLVIGLVYLQTGLEKLLIGGPGWLHPETFRNYLYLHQAPLGLWVAGSDVLCVLLPALALGFELGFILVVFRPAWAWVFLPAGVLFHAGTYLLLGVGWYFNGWIATYIFFIPWEKVGPLYKGFTQRRKERTQRAQRKGSFKG
ncbi:MAG: hypothetical protein ICV83_22840 [Cytophagales bacterium]|nr:hypothetical protein [Cytophagales bacterium]